jgi:predicted O-methyltransferase YrrM
MDLNPNLNPPAALAPLLAESARIGFSMASEPLTGSFLRTLAASKPGGRLLELGTGTGISTAWLLDGMDPRATLLSVDRDAASSEIARRHLGHDPRVTFAVSDGKSFLKQLQGQRFDLIFADTFPGKFECLELALDLLSPGALYVIDDLLPQPNWPEDHAPKVPRLIATLERRKDLTTTTLSWASGLLVATKRSPPDLQQ